MKWMIAVLCGLSLPAFLLTRDWFCEKFGPDAYIVNRPERREWSILSGMWLGMGCFLYYVGKGAEWDWGAILALAAGGYFGGAIYGMWAFNDRFQLITARKRLENPRRSIPEALPAPAQIEAAPITLEHDEGFAFDPARFGKVSSRDLLSLPSPDMRFSRESMTKTTVRHTIDD